jgi:hypothetical protein
VHAVHLVRHARCPLVAVAVSLVVVWGCRASADAMSDSTFVATMAELRRIEENASLDSAASAAARRRVLQGRGLSAEVVERHANALAEDPDRAAAVWQAIDRKTMAITHGAPAKEYVLPRELSAPGPRPPTRAR